MTTDRCPACNAAVPASAEWCTLCYAVLRAPEPVSAHVSAPAPGPVLPVSPVSPLAAQDPLFDEGFLDTPLSKAPPVAGAEAKGWPCLGCGALVLLADNACSQCGRPFLPSDEMPSLALPGVGDLSRMDRGQKFAVTAVLALLAMGVLVAIAFIAGSVL